MTTDVNLPCVSLTTGTLGDDLRVNYQYGMVLGLGEFLQEQEHFLFLDHLHERALHGYGTVYGAQVTLSPAPDDAHEAVITVEPGLVIDQWGREVVIRSAQCARLGAWLAAQEAANAGTVASHLGPSGELVLYVVASYAECPDDLVPLPGQPCSSSAQLQVPSRLRDAWDIELRWSPPPMPAWDADRRLAQLLNSVELVPGLDPGQSSEPELTAAVRALPLVELPGLSDPLWPPATGSPPGPATYQLPAETAGDALDRILTVFVTEVRPQLAPALTSPDPASDPAVLLSTLVVTPAEPFSVSSPALDGWADPDDTGRPYLLHTRLIQELRRAGGAVAAAGPRGASELVTLAAVADQAGVPTLSAWFHLDAPVLLPATVSVTRTDGQQADFTTAALPSAQSSGSFSDLWSLSAPGGFTVPPDELLEVTFPGTGVLVGDSATTLAAAAARGQVPGLDVSAGGDLVAYVAVAGPVVASQSLVTTTFVPAVQTDVAANAAEHFELWFHPVTAGNAETVQMVEPVVQFRDDLAGVRLPFGNPVAGPHGDIWTVATEQAKLTFPLYLRVEVDAQKSVVRIAGGQEMPLAQWIHQSGLRYVGWSPRSGVGPEQVTTFLRVAAANTGASNG